MSKDISVDNVEKNCRGFSVLKFNDSNGNECSLQISSSYDRSIWLGVHEVEAQFLAKDAKAVGVETDQTLGWIKYDLPKELLINSRMHLNVAQTKELIKLLTNFVNTGDFDDKE